VTDDAPLRLGGRAGALLLTGLALAATSVEIHQPVALEVSSSCGPAGRVVLEYPVNGCGGDPSWAVNGAEAVGLPAWAEYHQSGPSGAEDRWVLGGPVTLPGTEPPVTVRRRCLVGPEVAGVRALTCEGEAPEAACAGTLTPAPQPAAGTAP